MQHPTFGFTSSEPGSTFKRRLDGAATFTNCASPKTYTGLATAPTTSGSGRPTRRRTPMRLPPLRSFTVDTHPRAPRSPQAPPGTIKTPRELRIHLLGSELPFPVPARRGARCGLHSPKAYTGLANGGHTFRVRAIDRAGNIDSTPSARTFKVQP